MTPAASQGGGAAESEWVGMGAWIHREYSYTTREKAQNERDKANRAETKLEMREQTEYQLDLYK